MYTEQDEREASNLVNETAILHLQAMEQLAEICEARSRQRDKDIVALRERAVRYRKDLVQKKRKAFLLFDIFERLIA